MGLEPVHNRVAGGTERNQPSRGVASGPAVMNGALACCPAGLAAVAVAREHSFAATAKAPARMGGLAVAAAA